MLCLRLYLTMVVSLLILNPLGAQEVRRDTPEYLGFILPITKPDDPQVMRGHYLVTLGCATIVTPPRGPMADPDSTDCCPAIRRGRPQHPPSKV